jgi:hypothetical protein
MYDHVNQVEFLTSNTRIISKIVEDKQKQN